MKAIIDYKSDQEIFTAVLGDGQLLTHPDPTALAQLLVDAGVAPGDAQWSIWSLINKFEDIMRALAKGDRTWARLAMNELSIRMS